MNILLIKHKQNILSIHSRMNILIKMDRYITNYIDIRNKDASKKNINDSFLIDGHNLIKEIIKNPFKQDIKVCTDIKDKISYSIINSYKNSTKTLLFVKINCVSALCEYIILYNKIKNESRCYLDKMYVFGKEENDDDVYLEFLKLSKNKLKNLIKNMNIREKNNI